MTLLPWLIAINEYLRGSAAWRLLAIFVPLGLLSGLLISRWCAKMVAFESQGTRSLPRWASAEIVAALAVIYPALVFAINYEVQGLPEGGSMDWNPLRLVFHLILLTLLVAATTIDLDQYLIPDQITVPGVIVGIGIATGFGNMHLMPVWVDWNRVHVIYGPYIPEWIKTHPHWHGLVFSLAGLAIGAGITWLSRLISQWVLGTEALGFGDVTLMAMIGSFLGWQPVVFVFLLAPPCGIVIAIAQRLTRGRRMLPYGPFLSAATVVVLFGWALDVDSNQGDIRPLADLDRPHGPRYVRYGGAAGVAASLPGDSGRKASFRLSGQAGERRQQVWKGFYCGVWYR